VEVATANPLHVIVSSPSSVVDVILPILGLIMGALLTYLLSGATLKRLRRNEQRFIGYVAIQRFLISTCEQAEFEVAEDVKLDPPRTRPVLDVIGRELEATANLVASRQVLEALHAYTSALNRFVAVNGRLKEAIPDAASPGERQELATMRIALTAERKSILTELQKSFGVVNAAMRMDLDIEAIDWSAFENTVETEVSH
jgi:hypothetical protein